MASSLSDPTLALSYLHQAVAYGRLLATPFAEDALRAVGIPTPLDKPHGTVASVGNMRLDSEGRRRQQEQTERERTHTLDD